VVGGAGGGGWGGSGAGGGGRGGSGGRGGRLGWPHRGTDIADLTHDHDPGVLPADLDGYLPSLGSTA